MSNHYTPPNAELIDDTKSKGRMVHALSAAIAGFVSVFLLAISFNLFRKGDLAQLMVMRVLLICCICSVIIGLSILPFRELAVVKAALIGTLLSPVVTILLAIIYHFLTLLT